MELHYFTVSVLTNDHSERFGFITDTHNSMATSESLRRVVGVAGRARVNNFPNIPGRMQD